MISKENLHVNAIFLLAVLIGLLLYPPTGIPKTRALVIGINKYSHIENLSGAVNDAKDIAAALRSAGVDHIVELLDEYATRERIHEELKRIAKMSQGGDTVVITYAGHGGQEPERRKGTEEDGKDEVLLLSKFQEERPGNRERITDDELNDWFQLIPENSKIVFVADACHAGTLTRSIDDRAAGVKTRVATYGPIIDDELPLPSSDSGSLETLTNLVHLSAGTDLQLTFEFPIDGRPRGALSWSFARAIRGEADYDKNGRLNLEELRAYVIPQVRAVVEGKQHPAITSSLSKSTDVVPVADTSTTKSKTVSFSFIGSKAHEYTPLGSKLVGAELVSEPNTADLILDTDTREVLNSVGDVTAYLEDFDVPGIQAIIGKLQIVKMLQSLTAISPPLMLRIRPTDKLYRTGDIIEVRLSGQNHKFLTLFDIASDGTLLSLFPLSVPDPQQQTISLTGSLSLPFEVTPPYGADHVVAIVTSERPSVLQTTLQEMHGQTATAEVIELVRGETIRHRGQVGVIGMYTAL